MYEDSSPGAEPSSPRTKNWNATPYSNHEKVLAIAAVQMLAGGTDGGATSRPIKSPTQLTSGGRNRGAASRTMARTSTDAPTSTGCPSSFAPVTITIAVPVARLTVCIITDEPAAA